MGLNLQLGQVVYSIAGRDSQKKFVVIGIADDNHLLIADGDLRRIEKPKKKKIKHLNITSEIIANINSKLENKIRLTNAEVRKALASDENTLGAEK